MTELSDKVSEELHRKIVGTTILSEREAELYVLKEKEKMSIKEAAEEMDVSPNTLYGYWNTIKDKIRKARETSELETQAIV